MSSQTHPIANFLAALIFWSPLALIFWLKQYWIMLIYGGVIVYILTSAVSNSKWAFELIREDKNKNDKKDRVEKDGDISDRRFKFLHLHEFPKMGDRRM